MLKKIFPILAVLIFINASFIPVIGTDNKEGLEREDISVKIYTLEGVREIKGELPTDAIRKLTSLLNTNQNGESIDELLLLLEKHGLLGDFSLQKVREFITGDYPQRKGIMERMKVLSNTFNIADRDWLINTCCFFAGGPRLTHIFPRNLCLWTLIFLIELAGPFLPHYPEGFMEALWSILFVTSLVPVPTTIGVWGFFDWYIGRYINPSTLTTVGLLGTQILKKGTIFAVALGFTGIVVNWCTFGYAVGFTPLTIAFKR